MTAPVTETGYVLEGVSPYLPASYITDETVPELQWPNSILAFARMAREDSRIASMLQAIMLPLKRANWRVEPNGAKDEIVEFVSRDLNLDIKGVDIVNTKGRTKGRFSWRTHLHLATLQLKYGHAYFEQVYRIDDDGKAHLRKLAPRPAQSIAAINVARDGGLESIEQWAASTRGGVRGNPIPVSRLVAYVRDPEPGDWVGQSILRPAYKHWLLKDELMRIQAAAARRNGLGVPAYTAQEGASDEDIEKGRKMASSYRAGMGAGLAMPYGAKMELLGVQGNLPDIQAAIAYHDKAIALAALAHFLNLDGGGSYALASVQENTFVQAVQAFSDTILDVANAHIIEDLVDINFGEEEQCPRLVVDEIGTKKDAVAESLKILVDAGILRPDRSLENFVRDDYGLPTKDLPSSSTQPADTAAPAPQQQVNERQQQQNSGGENNG